jgi:hypothetical protein
MLPLKAFNLMIQESYDAKRAAYARSQESTDRMLRTLLKELETVRVWLKPTHYSWFESAVLV